MTLCSALIGNYICDHPEKENHCDVTIGRSPLIILLFKLMIFCPLLFFKQLDCLCSNFPTNQQALCMYSSTNGVEKIYSDTTMAAQFKEKHRFLQQI